MTVRQLAALANTSPGTVSKAFSGSRDISEETRARIFAIAKAEGCFEKYDKGPRARSLVLILCPETESEYYGKMAGLLTASLGRAGWDSVVVPTGFDEENAARLFSLLAYRLRADGAIMLGCASKVKNPEKLPLIVVGSELAPEGAEAVRFNTFDAVLEGVTLLKELGHRRIAFIGEEKTEGKRKMFCDALRRCGLQVRKDLLLTQALRFGEGGYAAMKDLLFLKEPPTAVVAAYDYMALGALRCCRDAGLSIPGDISLIGMDDLEVDPYLDVPLTSVRTGLAEGCDRVVELLIAKKNNRHFRSRCALEIRAELCKRASVGKAKESGN